MNETNELTPAEIGLLAAALDDARRAGLGDDDTLQMIANAAITEEIADNNEAAWSLAYDFLTAP